MPFICKCQKINKVNDKTFKFKLYYFIILYYIIIILYHFLKNISVTCVTCTILLKNMQKHSVT